MLPEGPCVRGSAHVLFSNAAAISGASNLRTKCWRRSTRVLGICSTKCGLSYTSSRANTIVKHASSPCGKCRSLMPHESWSSGGSCASSRCSGSGTCANAPCGRRERRNRTRRSRTRTRAKRASASARVNPSTRASTTTKCSGLVRAADSTHVRARGGGRRARARGR